MSIYAMQNEFHMDLVCWIMHEMISLSEPKKTHLILLSYLKKTKTSDLIEMVGGIKSSDRPRRD